MGAKFMLIHKPQTLHLTPKGSTDLTHTGGHFGSARHGPGPAAEAFARANDGRLLELLRQMQPEKVVPEVRANRNACGGGAIAATMAAARELGASQAVVLDYDNSYCISRRANPGVARDDTTVGYASVVFG